MSAQREAAIQAACHEIVLRNPTEGLIAHSIPNEGKRSKALGAKMVKMGLTKGVADYMIFYRFSLIYFEFKCPDDIHGKKTYQSKDQKEFQEYAEKADGAFYFVVRSTAEFIGVCKGFGLFERVKAF